MSGVLRAGQVAEAVGINVETLRYYGRRGILSQPDRSPGAIATTAPRAGCRLEE